jgi:hypothetical protein
MLFKKQTASQDDREAEDKQGRNNFLHD